MARIPQEIREFIETRPLGVIATDGPSGINVAPKGSLSYFDEEHLIFSDRFSDKTRINLEDNSKCSVAFIDREKRLAFQFKGTAALIDAGPLLDSMNNDPIAVERKYPPARYAVMIKVDEIYNLVPGAGGKPAGSRIA